jgi:hypothetical protein
MCGEATFVDCVSRCCCLRPFGRRVTGKLLNLGLILTSLAGYLEWGTDQRQFLWQMELEVLSRVVSAPASVIHPFTVIPLAGQALLLLTLFQRRPSRRLSLIGLSCLALLFAFMLFIGVIGANHRIALSAVPFLALAVAAAWHHGRGR